MQPVRAHHQVVVGLLERLDRGAETDRDPELAQARLEHVVQRHPRHGHEGRDLRLVHLHLRQDHDGLAVRAEHVDLLVRPAHREDGVEQVEGAQRAQRGALQADPDARRPPVALDLEQLAAHAAAGERDRRRHAAGPSADDQGALDHRGSVTRFSGSGPGTGG